MNESEMADITLLNILQQISKETFSFSNWAFYGFRLKPVLEGVTVYSLVRIKEIIPVQAL